MIVTVLQLIAVFGVPVLILRQREKGLVRTFGTIAMAYFWGIVVAVAAFLCRKAGLDVRLNADVGQIGSYVCIGLAIPLLMFGTNLADVRRLAKPVLISFVLLLLAVSAVVVVLGRTLGAGFPWGQQLAAMAAGMYTGGSPNFNAIGVILGVPGDTIAIGNLSDMIVGTVFYIFILTLAKPLCAKVLDRHAKQGAYMRENGGAENVDALEWNGFHRGIVRNLALSLACVLVGAVIGFGVNLSGGADCLTAKVLQDMTNCLLKVVSLISYYAPVAFFGFFASLVATYGAQITAAYGRAMLVYYPLCFVYALAAFPLYAYLGGGKEGVRVMRRHILRPAVTALGTCSSVATIPTNLEAAEDSGVPRDISDLVLPLGATMHMDGSCFSCVLKIAFLFGVFGIPFEGAGLIVKILLVAVFSSVAMSGIPGGGYIGEYIICTLFFPAQMAIAYPIAVTIGNLVDPPATMINSAGDYVVSFLVARFTEGKDWLERAQREKAAH